MENSIHKFWRLYIVLYFYMDEEGINYIWKFFVVVIVIFLYPFSNLNSQEKKNSIFERDNWQKYLIHVIYEMHGKAIINIQYIFTPHHNMMLKIEDIKYWKTITALNSPWMWTNKTQFFWTCWSRILMCCNAALERYSWRSLHQPLVGSKAVKYPHQALSIHSKPVAKAKPKV